MASRSPSIKDEQHDLAALKLPDSLNRVALKLPDVDTIAETPPLGPQDRDSEDDSLLPAPLNQWFFVILAQL